RPRQDLIKSAGHCSKSALDKRAKDVAAMIKETFIQNSVFKYHKKDSILLKSFEYTVNGQNYYLSFGTDNAQKEYDILNIVKIMDSNYISHDAYRSLAAIDYHLPREHLVVIERNNLTQRMTKDIPIKLVDINTKLDSLEIVEDDVEDVEEDVEEGSDNIDYNKVLNSVGVGGYRDCQKVKHVMTFMILNDQEHHHIPSYHHTIALYPGIEKYKSLEVILNPFLNNLRDLKVNGIS
ncbi:1873_t:CDS:2, partial [Racocetra fulgida]